MGKGESKGKDGKGKDGKGVGDASHSSPFGPLATGVAPWPAMDTTSSSIFAPPNAPVVSTTSQEVADMAAALKEAYPDEKTRPANVQSMIEKAERDAVKDVAKGLHSATKALSKAQKLLKENADAKRQHRSQWAKHVGEAIQTWQNQLREYRRQQTAFQDVSNRAQKEIETARQTIQTLNAQAASTGIAAPPVSPAMETEELTTEIDTEEDKLQKAMQSVLQHCAQSLGMDLPPSQQKDVQESILSS